MAPDKKELRDVNGATASTVGDRLRSVLDGLLTISTFPRARLTNLLYRLTGDIYELEGLVVGEQRTLQEDELSTAFVSSRKKSTAEILAPFSFAKPIQEFPEVSTDWGALAYHHVRRAQMALENGDEVAFWREFYAARRMELFGFEELGEEYLEMQAHTIKLEAAGLAARNGLLRLDPPRKEAIESILGSVDDYGKTDDAADAEQAEQLTAGKVGAAMDILHEFYVDQRLTGRILKRNLQSFIAVMALSAITFLAAFLSIPLQENQGITDRIELLQSSLPELVGLSTGAQLVVLILIVVSGIMGASVSGILSISRELQRSRIPKHAGTVWFAVARLATGGVAALMLFLFLISGIVSLGGDSTTGVLTLDLGTDLTLALAFSLSFVAGFSERLLVRVVESIAGETST